jgi:hypothetical protein
MRSRFLHLIAVCGRELQSSRCRGAARIDAHATAVRVTLVTGANGKETGAGRAAGSGGFDRLRAEFGAHGAPEQLKQHNHPIPVAQFDKPADHVLERTRCHPH